MQKQNPIRQAYYKWKDYFPDLFMYLVMIILIILSLLIFH